MTVNEIITLLNAGYTKAEIEAFENSAKTEDDDIENLEDVIENVSVPNEKVSENKTENVSEKHENVTTKTDRYDELLSAFEKLTKTIQASNLTNDSFESAEKRDVESILTDIIGGKQK